jgi:hypothetical protein
MLAGEALDHRDDAIALPADAPARFEDVASMSAGHGRIVSRELPSPS